MGRRKKMNSNLNNKKIWEKEKTKIVLCSKCQSMDIEISDDAVGGICWLCCQKMVGAPQVSKQIKSNTSPRPVGWHFMSEFIDLDGNVFHKGVEQPKLKGTLPPTKIKQTSSKKKKMSTFQKEHEKLKMLTARKKKIK